MSTNKLVTYRVVERICQEETKSKKQNKQQKEATVEAKTDCSVKVVVTEKSRVFVKKLLNKVVELKKHNERKISQFR